MIKSMTGFGRGKKKVDGREIEVEVRSVNHRYFEFGCKISREYTFLEEKIRSHIQRVVLRGKVDVLVSISDDDNRNVNVEINHLLASGYFSALTELKNRYSLSGDIGVSDVARFSDIFSFHKEPEDEGEIWTSVKIVLDDALKMFFNMRECEGQKMREDILKRAHTVLSLIKVVEERSPKTVTRYRQRLEEKLKEILDGFNVDEQRILTEAAVFADRVSVAEETVRLRSHFDQMFSMIDSGESVGRKLDFILQEMNREVNTIGSKVQDAELAHVVVDIKGELEKIREQIQNIE